MGDIYRRNPPGSGDESAPPMYLHKLRNRGLGLHPLNKH